MSVYSTPQQLREQREVRKEQFLTQFNNSPKYQSLRDRLKKVLVRLAVEKYKKTVGKIDKEKFKAELYCFVAEQMRRCLDQVFA